MYLVESTEKKNFYNDEDYINFVVAYDGDIQKEIDSIKDASIFLLMIVLQLYL